LRPFVCSYEKDVWIVREGPTRRLMDDEKFYNYLISYQEYARSDMLLMQREKRTLRMKLQWLRDNVWNKHFRWDPVQGRIVEVE